MRPLLSPSLLPREVQVLERFRPAFTAPTYERFLVLCVGAIITMGRRSVSRILWSAACLMDGHASGYHRFFSAARWSTWALARVLAAAVMELVPPDRPVVVIADDTVDQHRGDRACSPRDATGTRCGRAGRTRSSSSGTGGSCWP